MLGHSLAVKAACCVVFLASTAYPQGSDRPDHSAASLEQLVEHALRRNPDLVAARQRLAETQGLLRQAGLRPNPAIDFSVANGDVLNSRGERQFEVGYSPARGWPSNWASTSPCGPTR